MIEGLYVSVLDVYYFHPVLLLLTGLICSWIPPFFGGIYRLLKPLLSALAAILRKFTIF